MNRINIVIIGFIIFLNTNLFPQSDSINWKGLFKEHSIFQDVITEYYDDYDGNIFPVVYIDSIAVLSKIELDKIPTPIEGTKKFIDLIEYPEIVTRAGVERNLVVSTVIDTFGNAKDAEIQYGHYELFHDLIFSALRKTKFSPAIKNNKLIETQIAIAVSFFLKRNRNPEIDTIIVDNLVCDEICPSYIIKLSKDGEVTYEGRSNVDKLGKWKSLLNKNEFKGITSLIFAIKFFNMRENYEFYMNKFPLVKITVKADKITKIVKTNYYLPVLEIGKLIDYLTNNLEWEKIRE